MLGVCEVIGHNYTIYINQLIFTPAIQGTLGTVV